MNVLSPASPRPYRIRVRAIGYRRYFALWTIIVAVFAMQGYAEDAISGHTWDVGDYVRWAAIQWYTWALLAPGVFWLAAEFPLESPLSLRNAVAQIAASVAVTALAVVVGALVASFLEPGNPSFFDQLRQYVGKHVALGFLTYCALVAIQQAMHFYREKTERELHAARLAAELADSRIKILKLQLQPHFLFNTLHAIATLIDEQPDAAEDMVLRLSELLRAFLKDYEGREIRLERELALLDLYLGIQRTRFKDRLTTRVSASPDTLDCAVPTLILQPLVENAIRHGIGRHVGTDCIAIESYRDGDELCLDVRNENSTVERGGADVFARGVGLSNSRLRLAELYGDAARIHLDALYPRGAACRIRLPLKRLPRETEAAQARA